MLKISLLFFVFIIGIHASSDISTKITQSILSAISIDKYKVWIDTGYDIDEFIDKRKFNTVQDCKKADVLILADAINISKECMNKVSIVFDYDLLNKHENAVGTFFWKKGRPNIVFVKDRIEKFNIVLPESYIKYIEETIW
jgi:hypothetical protein